MLGTLFPPSKDIVLGQKVRFHGSERFPTEPTLPTKRRGSICTQLAGGGLGVWEGACGSETQGAPEAKGSIMCLSWVNPDVLQWQMMVLYVPFLYLVLLCSAMGSRWASRPEGTFDPN